MRVGQEVKRFTIVCLMIPLVLLGGLAGVAWWIRPDPNAPDLGWSDVAIRETQRRGDIVVSSLTSFKAQHKRYPKDLQELQSWSGVASQPPTIGKGLWVYFVDSKTGEFDLAVWSVRDEAAFHYSSGYTPPSWTFRD